MTGREIIKDLIKNLEGCSENEEIIKELKKGLEEDNNINYNHNHCCCSMHRCNGCDGHPYGGYYAWDGFHPYYK